MNTRRPVSWWLFWSTFGLLIYTYILYPVIMVLRGWLLPRAVISNTYTPRVSFIIAAYNEASVIEQKLANTLALDYPMEQLEILIASDGSTDGTNELVATHAAPNVRLLAQPRQGKNRTLNAAVAAATGEILVFSDADCMLVPEALQYLVAPFADPDVGGVGGEHRYPTPERGYFNLKRKLKQLQSGSGTMTAAEGQLYAIRRSLYQPVPLSATDDFFISLQVPMAHKRLVFESRAVAHELPAAGQHSPFRRKTRIMTRWLYTFWQVRRLLNPLEYGFYAIQFFSHKVARRLVVVPMLLFNGSAALLWRRGWLYRFVTLALIGFHGSAAIGAVFRTKRLGRIKVFRLPYYFDMSNVAVLIAFWRVLRGERRVVWEPERVGGAQRQNGHHLEHVPEPV